MTLEQYLKIMLKHWRLIVICFVLVGAGAYIGSRLMTTKYQSKAIVEIAVSAGNNVDYYSSLLASDQLVQTEATLVTSYPVLHEVASHFHGLSVEQLSSEVTATPIVSTQLFEIDVQDPNPTRAAVLANDIAVTFINQQNQLMQQNIPKGGSLLLIAQSAQPPVNPASPNKLLYTGAGLLTGLLLGMLLALLFELLDTRVRTPEALTEFLNWSSLATIWSVRSSKKEDVFNPTGHDRNIEPYRILRTNIGFSGVDKSLQTLIVTSAMPHEGKTTIAANLAIFMAKAGKTTLLIDADLRHPMLHDLFGLSKEKLGLSNAVLAFSRPRVPETPALKSEMPDTTSVEFCKPSTYSSHQLHSTTLQLADAFTATNLSLEPFIHAVDIPNLWVMPSGPLPPNPPELLDSKAMQRLLKVIANLGVEVVIFDTPPLLGLSDVSILAPKVDGTLLVVDITRANKKHLKQAKTLLLHIGAHVLGCVVNKQRRSRQDATYSNYLYHTGEQNGEGNNHGAEDTNIPTTLLPILKQPEMQDGGPSR